MTEIIIYAAILFAIVIGVWLGCYLALLTSSKEKKEKTKTKKNKTVKPDKKKQEEMQKENEEAETECRTISLKDELESRKGTSFTSFECEGDEEEESEIIDAHQKESNQAYEYLAKQNS